MGSLREMSAQWFGESAAQEIEKDVSDWLSSERVQRAKQKWLWELLQNALDAAVAAGQKRLDVSLAQTDGDLLFSHNGAEGVFSQEEFFRLLTRGTSKRQADSESEGRFGEGFAVTHILSRVVKVSGTERRDDGYRRFEVKIDRTGGWQQIADCIRRVIGSVDELAPLESHQDGFAEFRYIGLDERAHEALRRGLSDQLDLILYVLALASVRHGIAVKVSIATNDLRMEYEVVDGSVAKLADSVYQVRVLERRDGDIQLDHEMLLYATATEGHYLIVPVSVEPREVVLPPPGTEWSTPRLFTSFPLLKTNDIPLRCVVAGVLGTAVAPGWQVDKDRFDFNYEDHQAADILKKDIGCIPQFWQWLTGNGYAVAYRVLGVCDTRRETAGEWWRDVLRELVTELVELPAVAVESQPAELYAATKVAFPALPGDTNDGRDEPDDDLVYDVWELTRVAGLAVPAKFVLLDWYIIARGWYKLGVTAVERHDLRGISELVGQRSTLKELVAHRGSPGLSLPGVAEQFLGRLVQAYASYASKLNSTPDFISNAKVYCSQSGQLHTATGELHVDEGVSGDLKHISSSLCSNLPDVLLIAEQSSGTKSDWCLQKLQLKVWKEQDALRHVLDSLQNSGDGQTQPDALVDLLLYLFRHREDTAVMAAVSDWHALPVVTADGGTTSLAERKTHRLLAPEGLLVPDLTQRLALFPRSLILADMYFERLLDKEHDAFKSFLADKQLASADGFFRASVDLDQAGVRLLSASTSEEKHSFRSISMCDVVGLKELLGGAAGDPNSSKPADVLRFLLDYVAAEAAPGWHTAETVTATCTTHGSSCTIELYPAEWLRRAKQDSWVRNSQGDMEPPNGDNLEGLLGQMPESLSSTAARNLLVRLGCDRLNLEIVRFSAGDASRRKTARNALAAIAASAKSESDLQLIQQLWSDHEREKERVNTNHALGEIVQVAVAHVFRESHVAVWGDHIKNLSAHDLKVLGRLASEDLDVEDILLQLRPDSPDGVWVEVKTASSDEVKMTRPQARAAVDRRNGGYVLCVVDFRRREVLRQEAVAAAHEAGADKEAFDRRVADLAPKLVDCIKISRVGTEIRPKLFQYADVECPDSETGVRVESGGSPRFVIPASLWDGEAAISLEAWIDTLPAVEAAERE